MSTGSNNINEQDNATTVAWAEKTKQPELENQATSPALQTRPPKKTLKNRFILDEVIAKGGMGIVYKARDLRKIEAMDNDPYVAIKLLKPGSQSAKKDFINLQRETRKTQILSHPNIVNVHDFDRDGDIFMMTMEYLKGKPLSDLVGKGKPLLPRKKIFHIIQSIGQALIYAHSKNIIHCDLKPANIILTTDNTIKVLDFGIARAFQVNKMLAVNETLNQGGQMALTPTYASCEMLVGKIPEPRDDIYALACISYELLTGKHPFNRKNCRQAMEQGLLPVPVEGLTRKQWKALSCGLAAHRNERPVSIEKFIQAILPASQKEKYRLWAFPAISSVLLLGLFLINSHQQPASDDQTTIPAVAFTDLSQEKQEEILALLEIADAHMMVQRYTDPPGSNAFIAYQKILELHPSNPQALAGIEHIADAYVNLSRSYQKNGNEQMARRLIKEGLDISPGHKALLKLKEHFTKD